MLLPGTFLKHSLSHLRPASGHRPSSIFLMAASSIFMPRAGSPAIPGHCSLHLHSLNGLPCQECPSPFSASQDPLCSSPKQLKWYLVQETFTPHPQGRTNASCWFSQHFVDYFSHCITISCIRICLPHQTVRSWRASAVFLFIFIFLVPDPTDAR